MYTVHANLFNSMRIAWKRIVEKIQMTFLRRFDTQEYVVTNAVQQGGGLSPFSRVQTAHEKE